MYGFNHTDIGPFFLFRLPHPSHFYTRSKTLQATYSAPASDIRIFSKPCISYRSQVSFLYILKVLMANTVVMQKTCARNLSRRPNIYASIGSTPLGGSESLMDATIAALSRKNNIWANQPKRDPCPDCIGNGTWVKKDEKWVKA